MFSLESNRWFNGVPRWISSQCIGVSMALVSMDVNPSERQRSMARCDKGEQKWRFPGGFNEWIEIRIYKLPVYCSVSLFLHGYIIYDIYIYICTYFCTRIYMYVIHTRWWKMTVDGQHRGLLRRFLCCHRKSGHPTRGAGFYPLKVWKLLPRKLTCPLKDSGWKNMFLLKWSVFRRHLRFWGCTYFLVVVSSGFPGPSLTHLLREVGSDKGSLMMTYVYYSGWS